MSGLCDCNNCITECTEKPNCQIHARITRRDNGDTIQVSRAEYEELQHTKKLYDELLYNVASKYENETRHQTALRYIRHAEEPKDENCAASEGEK
jgi:hypothetical protein